MSPALPGSMTNSTSAARLTAAKRCGSRASMPAAITASDIAKARSVAGEALVNHA